MNKKINVGGIHFGVLLVVVTILPFKVSAQMSTIEDENLLTEILVTGGNTIREKTEISLNTERLFSIAGAGEDPLQAILALPGVSFNDDGEPVIRGSAPGDNAFYIDLVPASKLYHIWGNSILNKYVIQNLDLYPAAFPSRFGNATGGVIDVSLREPRNGPLTTTASISALQAAVLVESGITKNQAIYISARRSLLDRFLSEDDFSDEDEGIVITDKPISSDYQLKYLWHINDQNTLSFLATGADDDAGLDLTESNNDVLVDPDLAGPIDYSEKFDSQGLHWYWQSKDEKTDFNILATRITEKENFFYGAGQFFNSEAEKTALRIDFSQTIFNAHELMLGVIVEDSRLDIDARTKFVSCSDFDPHCPTVDVEISNYKNQININHNTAYLQGKYYLGQHHTITAGLHYSSDDYLKESRVEPRLNWQYQINDNWQTYVSAGQYSQLPELDEMLNEIGNPDLKTMKANHFVWGISQSISQQWRWKMDWYYKDLTDVVISITDLRNPEFDKNYSNNASGLAYGAEFQLSKDRVNSQWDGWVALSLGKAERTDLFNDETMHFDHDRPVKLDIVVNYHLNTRWKFGFRWTYQTGDRYTPIVAVAKNVNNTSVLEPVYGQRNSYTSPAYHRLDLRAEYRKSKSWGEWAAFIDIINFYGRENITGYSFAPNQVDVLTSPPDGFGDNVPVQTSVSDGAIPSIGFEVKF